MYKYIRSMTDEEMESELKSHFSELNSRLEKFHNNSGRTKGFKKFEEGFNYLERHSLQSMINSYIRWFNQSISNGYNGLDDWDPDDTMSILYKDGTIRIISPQEDDGTKKIKTDGIDSIILDGGWGTAYAGPHIKLYNYREVVDYGKWGYRDVAHRYNDDDSIRVDFDI